MQAAIRARYRTYLCISGSCWCTYIPGLDTFLFSPFWLWKLCFNITDFDLCWIYLVFVILYPMESIYSLISVYLDCEALTRKIPRSWRRSGVVLYGTRMVDSSLLSLFFFFFPFLVSFPIPCSLFVIPSISWSGCLVFSLEGLITFPITLRLDVWMGCYMWVYAFPTRDILFIVESPYSEKVFLAVSRFIFVPLGGVAFWYTRATRGVSGQGLVLPLGNWVG